MSADKQGVSLEPLPQKPTGAALARHRSEQEVETDPLFIQAVVRRFGAIDFDLAASAENSQSGRFTADQGPFYSREVNSLVQPWRSLNGNLWLNPEFSDIAPWARKCRDETAVPHAFQRILMLTPASVGANWFAEHVWGHAFVIALNGRLTFVGSTGPYPKDLMLSVYGDFRGFDVWNWRVT